MHCGACARFAIPVCSAFGARAGSVSRCVGWMRSVGDGEMQHLAQGLQAGFILVYIIGLR